MTQRIRGRAGQQLRRNVLAQQPLCVECSAKGFVRLATEVDHRVPLFMGGDNSLSNLAPLCHECHVIKTARDMGQKPKQRIGPTGYPVE